MSKFRKWVAFRKADDGSRTVSGLMTAELPDKTKEILDLATSAPYIKAWSTEASKGTDGESLGNVREMHQAIAAGKLTELDIDETKKAVFITAEIVDDSTWQKIEKRVLRGFSIGGEYVKKWKDGKFMRYTANINEVSVVDNPALKEAQIDFSAGADVDKASFVFAKADGSGFACTFSEDATPLTKADVEAIVAEALAKKGATKQERLRESALKFGIDRISDAIEFLQADSVQKGMYEVGAMASCMETFAWLTSALQYEREFEGDDSKVPTDLGDMLEELIPIFMDLCEEESNELLARLRAMEGKSMTPEELKKALEKAKQSMSALHGHIAKAVNVHEKLEAHHEKEAAMHKAMGGHLNDALKCSKDLMGDAEKAAASAIEVELHKSLDLPAPAIVPVPAIVPAATGMTAEEIQKAIDKGVEDRFEKAKKEAAGPGGVRLFSIPRSGTEGQPAAKAGEAIETENQDLRRASGL